MSSEEMIIREIEENIDNLQLDRTIWENDRKKLIFNALVCYEDCSRLMVPYAAFVLGEDVDSMIHTNSDSIDMLIRWIFKYSKCRKENFTQEVNPSLYLELGMMLKDDAIKYRSICDSYICWSRKKSSAKLYKDKKGVKFEYLEDTNNFVEDYDLMRKRGKNKEMTEKLKYSQKANDALNNIIKTITLDSKEHLNYSISSQDWNTIYEKFSGVMNYAWKLPDQWKFNEITINDLKIFWRIISTKSFIHCSVCMKSGQPGCAVNDSVIITSRDQIVDFVLKYSDLKREVVEKIVTYLTYNEEYYKKKIDVLWAPFIELDKGMCAISPNLILSSNPERNLISLINKLDSDAYSRLSIEKESIMEENIKDKLKDYKNLIIKTNRPLTKELPDIDIVIFDDNSDCLLMCELKWLLESDSVQEVFARDEDLQKGLLQAKSIQDYANENMDDLLNRAYGKNDFHPKKYCSCVVTMNNIGTSKLNNEGINIIDYEMFCKLVSKNNGHLDKVIDIIKEGSYLHNINSDLRLENIEIEYGGYYFTFQAFEPLNTKSILDNRSDFSDNKKNDKIHKKNSKKKRNLIKKSKRINRKK